MLSLGICLEEREREKYRKVDTEPPTPWHAQALSRGAHWGLALGPQESRPAAWPAPNLFIPSR